MKLLKRYQSLNSLIKFTINAVVLGVLWFIFFYVLRRTSLIHPLYESLTKGLTFFFLKTTQFTLQFIGEDSLIYKKTIQQIGGNGILLDRGCLGRNLMGLFSVFLIAFPGSIRSKLWFIPLGIILIMIMNVARLTGLYLIHKYYPQYMHINHHLVFKYAVYTLTFLLWYVWIKKLRNNPT